VGPIIVPSPRVVPTGIPSQRVHAHANPQEGDPILGINLFESFEEEDNIPEPQYRTRANARHHSGNHVAHTVPRIFLPITFANSTSLTGTPISKPTPSNEPLPPDPSHISMANAIIHPIMGAIMEYRGLIADDLMFPAWERAAANYFVRLSQGVGGLFGGSNTILFIPHLSVPKSKTVTYGHFVADVRPNKE
jgi:hypothetical protein